MAAHAFISYVREDQAQVTRLAQALAEYKLPVWLDRESLVAGQRWKDAVREAIRAGDLFLACFSRSYFARKKSYMNEELILALDELRQRPTDRSWFVPISLDGSGIPQRTIGGGETLHDLQWVVDLSAGWERGVKMIARAAGCKTIDDRTPQDSPIPATLLLKAMEINTRRTRERDWDAFIWSLQGVTAAISEVNALYASTSDIVSEMNRQAPRLALEVETSMPSCAVRFGARTLMFSWLQPSVNTVSDAVLFVLDYNFRYYLTGPNRQTEPPVIGKYKFSYGDTRYGWLSENGQFMETKKLAEWVVDRLLSGA